MRKRIAQALALLLAAALLASCGGTAETAPLAEEGYRFTDALGQQLSISRPQRVVALMGGFAETWLLAGGELVGVTVDAVEERTLDLSEEIGVVGLHNSPEVETLLALDPDLVLLSSETAAHVALRDTLEGAGITAAYFSVTHFSDYLEMLQICTGITGREDLYRQNGLEVAEAIDALLEDRTITGAPTALLLITYSGGAAVQRSDSMTGRMLGELGCENLADQSPSLLREFSMEAVLNGDPDYIFLIAMGNDEEQARRSLYETVESNPAWQQLSAVQNGRYLLLPKELFLYKPTARWAESYAYLADLLSDE